MPVAPLICKTQTNYQLSNVTVPSINVLVPFCEIHGSVIGSCWTVITKNRYWIFMLCNHLDYTFLIHITWHAAEVATTYSAFGGEMVTLGCFFDACWETSKPKIEYIPQYTLLVIDTSNEITICVSYQSKTWTFGIQNSITYCICNISIFFFLPTIEYSFGNSIN